MPEESLPPLSRKVALYSAGGGFGGALLAIVVAKVLAGPCCCPHKAPDYERQKPAAVSALFDSSAVTRRVQPA
jgi:hypothetical protein